MFLCDFFVCVLLGAFIACVLLYLAFGRLGCVTYDVANAF